MGQDWLQMWHKAVALFIIPHPRRWGMSIPDPQLLLRRDNLCFISKSTTDCKLPAARHHDASSPHEEPRLPGDPAGVRLGAGALHHSRPAAGGLSGPPEAHHILVGGECGPLPACCQPHGSMPWSPHPCLTWFFVSRTRLESSPLLLTSPCESTCGTRRINFPSWRAAIICWVGLTDGPGNCFWLFKCYLQIGLSWPLSRRIPLARMWMGLGVLAQPASPYMGTWGKSLFIFSLCFKKRCYTMQHLHYLL